PPAHPNASFAGILSELGNGAVRSRIENRVGKLLQIARIEAENPTVKRIGVVIAGISNINNPASERQGTALDLLLRLKSHDSVAATHSCARYGSRDYDGAEGALGSVDDIKRVEPVEISAAFVSEGIDV